MRKSLLEILGSGLFVFLTTYLLQVHGRGVWTAIESWTGELVLMGTFVLVCALFGALFSWATGVRLRNFAVGGFAFVLTFIVFLESTGGPFDSPVHIVLNALFLIGFVLGAGIVERADRRGLLSRAVVFR